MTLLSYQLRIDETETQKKYDLSLTHFYNQFFISKKLRNISTPQQNPISSATVDILSNKDEPKKKAIFALTEIYISRPFQL